MCRHVGWLGRPRSVASLVLDPPYGLLRQSYAPRRQVHGKVNADGWGVGFFDGGIDDGPAGTARRWRSSRPLWSDRSFASVAPALSSGCVVAAVRSASAGMPMDESASAPFLVAGWLVSHNGRVDRTVLPPVAPSAAESVCDSALLSALLGERGPGRLGELVVEVGALDPPARLNVLASDGRRILATTWGDTLSILRTHEGVAVASEAWDDDPRWEDVPDRRLVEVTVDGVTITPLETP